jgi:hypothetical protein
MNYEYINKHKELFPAAVGITCKQFKKLLHKFSPALRLAEHKKAYEKKRVRDIGGGRKSNLSSDAQKLFFILFYYKAYPTFRLAQILFTLDKRNCWYWKGVLEPVLMLAVGYELKLPEVKVKSLSGLLTVCPSLKEFIVDAVERKIQRPKDDKVQALYYSGKKKCHSVKNQILVSPKSRRILSVSQTFFGTIHDKKVLEEDGIIYRAPPSAKGLGDLGYQGVKEENPLLFFVTPLKKRAKKSLSEAEKATNKAISSIRVRVEHPISYLKHFAILANTLRSKERRSDLAIKNIACLYNFTRNYRY